MRTQFVIEHKSIELSSSRWEYLNYLNAETEDERLALVNEIIATKDRVAHFPCTTCDTAKEAYLEFTPLYYSIAQGYHSKFLRIEYDVIYAEVVDENGEVIDVDMITYGQLEELFIKE